MHIHHHIIYLLLQCTVFGDKNITDKVINIVLPDGSNSALKEGFVHLPMGEGYFCHQG